MNLKKWYGRFLPVLILLLVACNLSNAGNTTVSAPTLAPTETIVSAATNIPLPGDLGSGDVTGKVTDALTGLPIANATVTCEHTSYTSNEEDRCHRTTTDQEGVFLFEKVFFHDTDTISLTVEAPGYQTEQIKQAFFTLSRWEVNIVLKPVP